MKMMLINIDVKHIITKIKHKNSAKRPCHRMTFWLFYPLKVATHPRRTFIQCLVNIKTYTVISVFVKNGNNEMFWFIDTYIILHYLKL